MTLIKGPAGKYSPQSAPAAAGEVVQLYPQTAGSKQARAVEYPQWDVTAVLV
jgi:hypothetical protein